MNPDVTHLILDSFNFFSNEWKVSSFDFETMTRISFYYVLRSICKNKDKSYNGNFPTKLIGLMLEIDFDD